MALSFLSRKKFHHLHARFISIMSQLVDTLPLVVSIFICFLLAALGLGCTGSSLPCGLASGCSVWGMLPSGHAGASPRSDFSFCEAQSLGAQDSVAGARGLSHCSSWALEHRADSGGAQASLPHSSWDRPGSGIELESPALAGGFFSTESHEGSSNFPHFTGE